MTRWQTACCGWLLISSGAIAAASSPLGVPRELPTTPQAMTEEVNQALAAAQTRSGVRAALYASDGEFIRRATLDLTGVVPRTSQVQAFLSDPNPAKRVALVQRLLDSPRYATHMATTWRNRIVPSEVDQASLRDLLALEKWLRTRFASNLRYDNIVGGLLATGGDELGPALYFRANDLAPRNWLRAPPNCSWE